jgi:hypothetical protein
MEIKAADGTRIAALAGLAPLLRLDGLPIAGTLKFAADGSRLTIDRLGLNVAGSEVKGQISVATVGDRRRVEARLDVDELSVAKLLSPLLDQRLAVTGVAETAISGRQSPWPDEPFDAAVLDGFEGNIRLNSRRLTVADGIGIGQANIDIALEGGKIDVTRIEGACLGGRCSASLRIDKAPAGVEVSGQVSLMGATLQAFAGSPRASGTIGGEIKFSGRGTSPRNALSALQGGGTIELADAKLAALWPGAIAMAAEAALKADPDKLAAIVQQTLVPGLAGGQLSLPRAVTLEITDGQLRVKPFTIDTADGRVQGGVSVDLRTLNLDSEWRLDQKPSAGPADKPALPTVTVTYRGPIGSLGGLEPRVASEALERELSVRRMERDVEELERLRKLDEARRREEAERQRRQFEQTPVPVPVAPAPPQPRPATPG